MISEPGDNLRQEIIRVFPRRTKWTPDDSMAFIGDPGLYRPLDNGAEVHISVAFLWDVPEGQRLLSAWKKYYKTVKLGGPAFGEKGGDFMPGRYLKQGVTITSRGCVKRCPWCYVWRREGAIRELPVRPGWIVQDNNLLACSDSHIEKVFEMLREQGRGIAFNGGLDATLLTDKHRALIDTISLKEAWFACDSEAALKPIERAARIMEGISQNKKRCYVLIGFEGETLESAERRLERVFELDYLPFAQLYKGDTLIEWPSEWLKLARKWSRPAAYKSKRGAQVEKNLKLFLQTGAAAQM